MIDDVDERNFIYDYWVFSKMVGVIHVFRRFTIFIIHFMKLMIRINRNWLILLRFVLQKHEFGQFFITLHKNSMNIKAVYLYLIPVKNIISAFFFCCIVVSFHNHALKKWRQHCQKCQRRQQKAVLFQNIIDKSQSSN